jgi:protein transport protein SEC61 subunit gamma-like protein
MEIKDLSSLIRSNLKSWDRVLKLSRKPRRQEFIAITKVTGLGAIVVGVIGFAIRMIVQIISRLR